uniref:Uncharacterized protein n=1 Tax=Parascaris univalens TaxID=6257 RepID=A0A915C3E9_PARUN
MFPGVADPASEKSVITLFLKIIIEEVTISFVGCVYVGGMREKGCLSVCISSGDFLVQEEY